MRMNRKYVPYLIILGAMVMLNLLNGRFGNIGSWIYNQLMMIPGIVIGLAFHEFAHGFVSHKLGDPTPKMQGRLTLNPASHIDPVGFLCLFFAGFGWGVSVQTALFAQLKQADFPFDIVPVIAVLKTTSPATARSQPKE